MNNDTMVGDLGNKFFEDITASAERLEDLCRVAGLSPSDMAQIVGIGMSKSLAYIIAHLAKEGFEERMFSGLMLFLQVDTARMLSLLSQSEEEPDGQASRPNQPLH